MVQTWEMWKKIPRKDFLPSLYQNFLRNYKYDTHEPMATTVQQQPDFGQVYTGCGV